MHRKNCYFQNEVPYQSSLLLKNHPDIAKAIVERFPVIIIDEAQDTSKDQMKIFELLIAAGLQEVILVGDPDQSIYEWRTAKRECFVDKINNPNWRALYLTHNFRSSQLICNATKAFSETYYDKPANKSAAEHKDFPVKPILLFYDLNTQRGEIIPKFKHFCETNNIELNKSAVVSRGRINSKNYVEGLWKNFLDAASNNKLLSFNNLPEHIVNYNFLLSQKKFMQIIQNGGVVKLHSTEWVNKSSGKGNTELIVDDGNGIVKYAYPYWFPFTPYKDVFPRLFPWADFSSDEDFFENDDESLWRELHCYYDKEDGEWIIVGDTFEEFRSKLNSMRSKDHSGEVVEYMMTLSLNDLGRSFLAVDEFVSKKQPYSGTRPEEE